MKTIVFSNNKGGVAKTTTTATIGDVLAKRGKRVLMLDCDAQGNLSALFNTDAKGGTMFDLFNGNPVTPTNIHKGLDITPATLDLVGVAMSTNTERVAQALNNYLQTVADKYDFVLIDTPPALSTITIATFGCADWVMIPTQAEPFAFGGLVEICKVIDRVHNTMNNRLQIAGILLTRYTRRRITEQAEQVLRAKFGKQVFNTVVHDSIAVSEGIATGQTVVTYAPHNRVADDYENATTELLRRIK